MAPDALVFGAICVALGRVCGFHDVSLRITSYMKPQTAIYSLVSLLALLTLLGIPFCGTSAQSDKADKYKLIFSHGYADDLLFKDPPKTRNEKHTREWLRNRAHLLQLKKSNQDSFLEQLNQAGAQGYRLFSTVDSPLVGIARLEEGQYEYALIETTGSIYAHGFEDKYAPYAKEGFQLYDYLGANIYCFMERCEDLAENEVFKQFLLERKKGVEKPVKFQFKQAGFRWSTNQDKVLTAFVNQSIAQGFFPTHFFSRLEVLLHQTTTEAFTPDRAGVQVVTDQKRIDQLAQQGFRLAFTVKGNAVMYRRHKTEPVVSYVWLDTMKKGFEQRLAQVQATGAIYRTTYYKGLVFEQPTSSNVQSREYKVLKFELQWTENVEGKRVEYDLTPASKETVKMLNSLAREGFEARDLFLSDKLGSNTFSVLLERSSSSPNNK